MRISDWSSDVCSSDLPAAHRPARPVAPLGLAALDDALPGGGLPLGALHEIEGERAEWDDGATLGFCLALLARLEKAAPAGRQILWVSRQGDLYPPALAGQGLDPGRFLLVRSEEHTSELQSLMRLSYAVL